MAFKISVVIPAFDRLASLRSVLQSCARACEHAELVVVDDKSPLSIDIMNLASEYNAIYVRNESSRSEREPALCRNLGLDASSGDMVVFNDADVLVAPNALDLHAKYHSENRNVVVDAQIWSIYDGQPTIDAIREFTLGELKNHAHRVVQDVVPWSTIDTPQPSDNWWAFLSAQCSFKRSDLLTVGRWDQEYSGWGVEDNDIGYRIYKHALRILYASDILCFHIDHTLSPDEYREKCRSALRNLKRMCKKYPEVLRDKRVRRRLEELEALAAGVSGVVRQGTAGGGPIKG
jgi:glycosyltransferase involved in cell wall biosynthesis